MRIMLVLAFIVLAPVLCMSQSLSLRIEVQPDELVLGLPFTIKLKLESNESFTLHGSFGLCDDHTKVIVKDDSGNPAGIVAIDCGGLSMTLNPFDSDAKKTYQGLAITEDEFYLPVGIFKMSAEYHSTGPYLDRYTNTDQRPVEGIWIGVDVQ